MPNNPSSQDALKGNTRAPMQYLGGGGGDSSTQKAVNFLETELACMPSRDMFAVKRRNMVVA
jgi:hypothetical protein